MKNKYNLALIPMSKSNELIDIARGFENISDKYLLGKNSLPHVTLYHFEAEEDKIDNIWSRVCNVYNQTQIDLELAEFSYITFDVTIHRLPQTSSCPRACPCPRTFFPGNFNQP